MKSRTVNLKELAGQYYQKCKPGRLMEVLLKLAQAAYDLGIESQQGKIKNAYRLGVQSRDAKLKDGQEKLNIKGD